MANKKQTKIQTIDFDNFQKEDAMMDGPLLPPCGRTRGSAPTGRAGNWLFFASKAPLRVERAFMNYELRIKKCRRPRP